MTADAAPKSDPCAHARAASPGRPKDLSKRAAILDAAKRMFTVQGYEGVSMDQIAAEAGVSKLTVYSHFGDKEALFVEAIKTHCERQMPAAVFEADPETAIRERLMEIAYRFFEMVGTPESIAGHRVMCTPHLVGSTIPKLFWEAGPKRIQSDFAELLERRVATGELEIDDTALAAEQFFSLLKGEKHLHMVLGFGDASAATIDRHLQASVDMFLRAYGTVRPAARRAKARGA